MATELKYNGEWLIPLQSGYRVEYPQGGSVRPAAVVVSASYRLRDVAMIRWWWQFCEANRGQQIGAMLDTAGYLFAHDCVIVEPPQFQEYAGHAAVLSLRLACMPSPPVVTQYATSWPYPALEVEALGGSMSMRAGGKLFGALGAGVETFGGSALLLPGGEIRSVNRDYDSGLEATSGNGCEMLGVTLIQTLLYVDYDSGFESVSGNGCEMLGATLVQTVFLVDYDSGFEATSGNGCELLSITLT